MDTLIGICILFVITTIYIGFYAYNRWRGHSAQFGPTRIDPDDSKAMKAIADIIIGITFAGTVWFLIREVIRVFFK